MYKSPIEVFHEQLQTKFEGDVVKVVQSYNINVDKDELIKAIAYDRGQYDAGYRDAMASIVRCKDCQHCALSYNDKRLVSRHSQSVCAFYGGTSQTMSELKPCPFCGGVAKVIEHRFYEDETQDFTDRAYGVECMDCFAKSYQCFQTVGVAVAEWNRRVEQ